MAKVPSPNYTQSPNVYFDSWLPEIKSLAELKVVGVVIRNTFGWHEKETSLSLTDIEKLTGLSRGCAHDGVKRALAHGYITRRTDGLRGQASYRVAVEATGRESVLVTSAESLPVISRDALPVTSTESVPAYIDKETKKNKETSAHADLMKFHYEHLSGPIPDPSAQGGALKWLLTSYAPDILRRCYEFQLSEPWRSKVNWLTVKSDIGSWLSRNGNGANKQNTSSGSSSGSDYQFKPKSVTR